MAAAGGSTRRRSPSPNVASCAWPARPPRPPPASFTSRNLPCALPTSAWACPPPQAASASPSRVAVPTLPRCASPAASHVRREEMGAGRTKARNEQREMGAQSAGGRHRARGGECGAVAAAAAVAAARAADAASAAPATMGAGTGTGRWRAREGVPPPSGKNVPHPRDTRRGGGSGGGGGQWRAAAVRQAPVAGHGSPASQWCQRRAAAARHCQDAPPPPRPGCRLPPVPWNAN